MQYTKDENLVEYLEEFKTFIKATQRFIDRHVQEAWLEAKDACAVAGVEPRRLRYLADIGRISTLRKGDKRGKLYKLSDCVSYRDDHPDEILKMKGGAGSA